MFVRHYVLESRAEDAAALAAALAALAERVRAVDGCAGAELLQEIGTPGRFVFLERWQSAEAHQAGADRLGKDAFAEVMALAAVRPAATSLQTPT